MGIKKIEFTERIDKVQRKMAEMDLDALVIYSWKRGQTKYFSGYFPNYIANTAAVLITQTDDPIMYIRFPFDLERAVSSSWIKEIRASGSNEMIANDINFDLKLLKTPVHRVGLVGGDTTMDEIPYSFVEIIKKGLEHVQIVDARNLIESFRIIKSASEIELIKKSARIADQAISHARDIIKPGVSEMDLVVEAENYIRKNGGDRHLVVIAAPGNTNLIRPATLRKIEQGEDIILEAAVEADGYWSQIAATFVCGEMTHEQSEIIKAVLETYKRVIDTIKPGIKCSDVAKAAIYHLTDLGFFKYIEQDFGHGIGLDLPEPPKIDLDDHTIIREGMIIIVHPAIRVKKVGSAFIGGTTLVNETGVEELHDIVGFYK